PAGASESRDALVSRLLPQLLLDAQELVVLRDAIRAGRRAGLDLPNAGRHGEVRDRGVLGLTGAMRHDGRVAGLPRDADRLERLRERPDLVHLDQDRVGDAALDPAPQALRVGDEQVIADQLTAGADALREQLPALPVLLVHAVLDRDDREPVAGGLPVGGHLLGRERAPLVLEYVGAVRVDLAGRRVERDVDVVAGAITGGLDARDERLE